MVEQELRELIVSKYKSVKAFSEEANLPYTTVDSILKRGVERADVKNIIKLCQALHIDTDALADGRIEPRRVKLKIAITPEGRRRLRQADRPRPTHQLKPSVRTYSYNRQRLYHRPRYGCASIYPR